MGIAKYFIVRLIQEIIMIIIILVLIIIKAPNNNNKIVFFWPYFPVFGPEKTPYFDTFHAVNGYLYHLKIKNKRCKVSVRT